MGSGTVWLLCWLTSHVSSLSLSCPICQVEMSIAASQAYCDFSVSVRVCEGPGTILTPIWCYCSGREGVLMFMEQWALHTWQQGFLMLSIRARGRHSFQPSPHIQTTSSRWIQQPDELQVSYGPEVYFLALTKHGSVTCKEATHWLNFQSISVTAEKCGLGLEEGSGHTIPSSCGYLLQPVLQWGDLVTERKKTQVEGKVGGWLAKLKLYEL